MRLYLKLSGLLVGLFISTNSIALTLPFTENFATDAAGWTTGDIGTPATYVGSGGPDGSSYISSLIPANAVLFTPGRFSPASPEVLFRCQDPGCSGDAFKGTWLNQVGKLSWYIRHSADIPLNAYIRLAPTGTDTGMGFIPNFPGASAFANEFTMTLNPNEWTEVVLPIQPEYFSSFSNTSFEAVFSQIDFLQIGLEGPGNYSQDSEFTLDLDMVHIAPVPLPAGAWLMLSGTIALIGAAKRRRLAAH
ncbi:MAG: VPLPA-CTERM sorting domain-containing protein [Pseudomonadota bacterium]